LNVAPINVGQEDPRINRFIETVGDEATRAKIKAFQIALLKREDEVLPLIRDEVALAVRPVRRDAHVPSAQRTLRQPAEPLDLRCCGYRRHRGRGVNEFAVERVVERDAQRDVAGHAGRGHGEGHRHGRQIGDPPLQWQRTEPDLQ